MALFHKFLLQVVTVLVVRAVEHFELFEKVLRSVVFVHQSVEVPMVDPVLLFLLFFLVLG